MKSVTLIVEVIPVCCPAVIVEPGSIDANVLFNVLGFYTLKASSDWNIVLFKSGVRAYARALLRRNCRLYSFYGKSCPELVAGDFCYYWIVLSLKNVGRVPEAVLSLYLPELREFRSRNPGADIWHSDTFCYPASMTLSYPPKVRLW